MAVDIHDIEDRLWAIADELRANSNLSQHEYKTPVLGLIFLKHADTRFRQVSEELENQSTGRRKIGKTDFHARGVLYLPDVARFDYLLERPEEENLGRTVNEAMKGIEEQNPELRGVLPRGYTQLTNDTLVKLLRSINAILEPISGDAYGKVYEYFLSKFSMGEGQRGGQFFTPSSLVRLIVEIIEPFEGKILDPACGSGGMFVQSAQFVERHRQRENQQLSVYGQEKTGETVKLAKMNLAINGLSGQIREANSYYEDPFRITGSFDYVMANPPFNVNAVDKARLENDPRYPLGLPKADNGNYLWLQLFYSALNDQGRAGFVMPNSACDARGSELSIREKLLRSGAVDTIISVSPNFFLTVSLPCTLWFLDKGKVKDPDIGDHVLFIDARSIFKQIDRVHREFADDQLEFIANIVRLYRGEKPEAELGSQESMFKYFPDGYYADVPGLCAVASISEIEAQGWSLNPGRYVGADIEAVIEVDFESRLGELSGEFELLTTEAAKLTRDVFDNIEKIYRDDQ